MQGLGAQPEADSDELDLDAGIQIESSHAIGGCKDSHSLISGVEYRDRLKTTGNWWDRRAA